MAIRPISVSIDAVADASLQARLGLPEEASKRCDVCGAVIEGEPAGSGLYVWMRGDEMRLEEPALCSPCGVAIGVTALHAWSVEEDEG